MIVSINIQIAIILIVTVFFMVIVFLNQLRQNSTLKQLIVVQSKIILGIGFFVASLIFLNSYYYLISSIMSFVLKISPIYVNSTSFEQVMVNKWFIIICTLLIAWIINAAIAYYTRIKYLFVSPVEMIILTTVMMTILKNSSISISNQIILISLLLGAIMSFSPWITARLCKGNLEGRTTLGLFHYIDSWICIGIGKLFGPSHQSTEEFVEKSSFKTILTKGWIGVSVFLVLITLALTFVAYLQGYHEQMRLVILDQFVVQGIWLHVVNVFSLLLGLGCFYGFYRLITSVYHYYLAFFTTLIPNVYLATDWVYQLMHCRSVALIGFITSYLASFITLMYFSFYQIEGILIPDMLAIGLLGILVAKMANKANGVKGVLIATFVNGILLTSIPTLSFHLLKALQIEGSFDSLDTLFISQLLDRLFIF